jgi:hypothetical protein
MRCFIQQQNIARFDKLLSNETDVKSRRTLETLLVSTRRELATLEASEIGLGSALLSLQAEFDRNVQPRTVFREQFERSDEHQLRHSTAANDHLMRRGIPDTMTPDGEQAQRLSSRSAIVLCVPSPQLIP